MKTPQQWAEHLPEPIKTEFLENIDSLYAGYEDTPDTIVDAIEASFCWDKTKQGWRYWRDIYDKAIEGEFDAVLNKS